MRTTYYLKSAQEADADLIDAIKATFKSKAITITIEEAECDEELTDEMKAILDERLLEDESTYLTEDELFDGLKKKYGF
ncbi:MAG TPA: hypothetical protein VFC69_06850 [Dysgonamonadaceae bacterium]|nr:hypothetical protein [Dysgonamonadaceae bacterium]